MINTEAVEQGLPYTSTSAEKRLPIPIKAVERGLPHISEAVDDEILPLIDENKRTVGPYVNDVVRTEPPRLAEGLSSSRDSDVPVSISGSRRKKRRNHKKGERRSPERRHSRRQDDYDGSVDMKSICAFEYVEGSPHRGRYIEA